MLHHGTGLSPPILLLTIILAQTGGCEHQDDRLIQTATEAARQQAEQNTEMAQLNREVAEGTNRLVTADAQSRQELLAAQRDLQQQQQLVHQQRDDLETERKEWARQRRTESVLAPIITTIGLTFLPLILCWQLLRRLYGSDDQRLGELIIADLLADQPLLLPHHEETPSPPAIGVQLPGNGDGGPLPDAYSS